MAEIYKTINGYHIYIGGTWCEVTKNGNHVYDGSVEEGMTAAEVYKQITKKLYFLTTKKNYVPMIGCMRGWANEKKQGKI